MNMILIVLFYLHFDIDNLLMSCIYLHIPQDPGTGIGKIMCTSIESFWEVALQLNDSTTPSKWEIASATKLAELDAYYAGGYSFIPSGSNKNNIFFADWDNSIVKMMKFDAAGRPVVPTQTTDFITGIDRPWGFFFDPKVTNLYSEELMCFAFLL